MGFFDTMVSPFGSASQRRPAGYRYGGVSNTPSQRSGPANPNGVTGGQSRGPRDPNARRATNQQEWAGAAPAPGTGFANQEEKDKAAGGAPGTEAPAYGSQSGPGILEQWFNMRAQGSDPAFEYGLMRGNRELANRYSAAGSFNSGAARQAESDLYANLLSQRMGQLDMLAGGASGEHQGRLNAMFGQGLGIAGGQAGQASAYDLGAAGNMAAANNAMNQMALNRAGVDAQGNQGAINNIMGIWGMAKAGQGGGNQGGGYNGNPYGY